MVGCIPMMKASSMGSPNSNTRSKKSKPIAPEPCTWFGVVRDTRQLNLTGSLGKEAQYLVMAGFGGEIGRAPRSRSRVG